MTEPYTIQINGVNCLIVASCLAEAKQKAQKMGGVVGQSYPIEDYKTLKLINEILKR